MAADPDKTGYVHLGGTILQQADDATLTLGGAPIPGAGFQTQLGTTLTLEAGAFIRGGFAVAASAMLPVTTQNIGTGVIAGLGNLGNETIGFYSIAAQYHLDYGDVATPYIGAGLAYMHVFDTTDGAVSNINVESAFGAVLQAGVDVAVTDSISVFADVKRYFLSTRATGTLGLPITANARVDPLVVSTGIGFNF